MRGATYVPLNGRYLKDISIHAPHAGCDTIKKHLFVREHISIHAPHAGCDCAPVSPFNPLNAFQSTHPMRGATAERLQVPQAVHISIHAPHAGCDRPRAILYSAREHFNPRTPCGVRHCALRHFVDNISISIHAPHAGCDVGSQITHTVSGISIHAPHAGCDSSWTAPPLFARHFNPRTPCGVRLPARRRPSRYRGFQSTHPMRGATISVTSIIAIYLHFNPRTPCGVRRVPGCRYTPRE